MREEIEPVLARLAGRALAGAERDGDVLAVRFAGDRSDAGGGLVLRVACAWRLTDGERVLVGAGDLFTPADPEEEPETFDWEAPGASWLDVRLAELAERRGGAGVVVREVRVDPYGGAVLAFGDGTVLELFPHSTPTGHVSTEFWRLTGAGDDVVAGTFGVEREPAA